MVLCGRFNPAIIQYLSVWNEKFCKTQIVLYICADVVNTIKPCLTDFQIQYQNKTIVFSHFDWSDTFSSWVELHYVAIC